jgi:hypothetical protein
MGLVQQTKRAQQNGPNEDYTQCRTNTRETVAWLQNGEAPRFAHLPLFSLSLLLTSLWTLLYLWTKYGTHTLFVSSLSFFFDWKYLFSLALGPLQNLLELGICTHSHDVGSSVLCFATLGKSLSKDKVTKGKEIIKEEESAKEKEICVSQSWPALAGVQIGFSQFGVFRETWTDQLFAARRPALAGSGFCANSSSLVAEIGHKNPQIRKK